MQDAWRLRCLGLTNSSSIMPSENQRHSPKSDNTTSSPLPLITQNLSNSQPSKIGDIKSIKVSSEESEQSSNKTDSFTLMHPAFQSVLHKRKYYGTQDIETAAIFDKNSSDRDTRNSNNFLLPNNVRSAENDCVISELSRDSSCSEEIDLTSSGCIDFSNNNNNISRNHNTKVSQVP